MANFEQALKYTLKNEGGWSNHPDDPGGATNHGITLKTAQRHGIHTAEELKAITPEKVANIYKADYWRFGGIKDQNTATKLFDMSVNMGTATAVKLLQSVLNIAKANLKIDGIFGPKTEAAVNSMDFDVLLEALCVWSVYHYCSIVERRPASQVFLRGWLHRANATPKEMRA